MECYVFCHYARQAFESADLWVEADGTRNPRNGRARRIMPSSSTLIVMSSLLLGIYIGARLVIMITSRTASWGSDRSAGTQNKEIAVEILTLLSSLHDSAAERDRKSPKIKRKRR
jgi:hypothetical protein